MTQERLRELLRERVAEETMPDYSERAWQRARVVRRRHRLGAVAGVVAATIGVAGGIEVWEQATTVDVEMGQDRGEPLAPGEPDATYQGVPVWWSPDQEEEQDLEPIGWETAFPDVIDFVDTEPHVPGELDRALAAFARGRDVVLLGPEGELRTVDVRRVEEVTTPNGYRYFPVGPSMLTPDGARLVFPQQDHDKVFSIPTGEWSTVPRGTAQEVEPPPVVPFDTSPAQQYGGVHDGAASWGMGVPVPARPDAVGDPGPEFLVAERDGSPYLLAFTWLVGDDRYKNCCPAAAWLARDWVVYESRQTRALLVAWHLGTDDFRLVSRIEGPYDVASFA